MKKQCCDRVDKHSAKRKICVMLDREQMELVEKLSVLLDDEEEGVSPADRIIEAAVRTFTEEKIRYIAGRYSIDVRSSTLTEMKQYKREGGVNIAARDTIVLPIPDSADNRDRVYNLHRWTVPGISEGKLQGIGYVAIYWRTPVWACTHYAKLISAEPAADGAVTLLFDRPEALPEPVSPRLQENRLRRPRYTTLSILLEAKTLEELF